MNTSAQAPQLAELQGTLVAPAQVRMLPCDREGHMVPVLLLDLRADGDGRNPIRVEQPFPADAETRCRAAAKRFVVGQRITFQTRAADLALRARNVVHIHIVREDTHPPTTEEPA